MSDDTPWADPEHDVLGDVRAALTADVHHFPTPAERYVAAVEAAQDAYENYRQRVLLGMEALGNAADAAAKAVEHYVATHQSDLPD